MAMAISSTVTRWSRCSEALLTAAAAAAVVWRGRHTITTSHQTANYEFEWPSSKTHLSLSLLLLLLCEKGMCTFALTFLRTSRIFINLSPNIEFDASPFAFGQENDRLENLFCPPKWLMILSFKIRILDLTFAAKFFLLIFKFHFDECRVKSFGKYGLMMQQIWN